MGAQRLALRELNRMVSEISGVPLPALRLPGSLAMAGAALLTWLADRIGQPPPWGMSADQIRTMKEGFAFDGGKAERELGLAYTPIRVAVEEEIASSALRNARPSCCERFFRLSEHGQEIHPSASELPEEPGDGPVETVGPLTGGAYISTHRFATRFSPVRGPGREPRVFGPR